MKEDYYKAAAIIGISDTTKITYAMESQFGKEDLSTLADFLSQIKDSPYVKQYWVGGQIIEIIKYLKHIDEFNLSLKTMQKIFSRGQDPFNIRAEAVRTLSFLSKDLSDFKSGLEAVDRIMSGIKDQRAIAVSLIYSFPTPPGQGSLYNAPEIGDTFIKNIDDLISYLNFMGEFSPSLLDRWIDQEMYFQLFANGKNGPLVLSSNLEEYRRGLNLLREFYDAMNKRIRSGFEMWDFNLMLYNNPKLNLTLSSRLNNELLYRLATPQDRALAQVVRNYEEFLVTLKAATKIALVDPEVGKLFKINLALFLLRIIPEFIVDSKNTSEFINLLNRFLESYNTQL